MPVEYIPKRATRNQSGMPGPKPKTPAERAAIETARVDARMRVVDEVGLREQLRRAWDESDLLDKAVKRKGRVRKNRFGEVVPTPEVAMRDRARTHLLAVSRALAAVLGLPKERTGPEAVISTIQDWEARQAGGKPADQPPPPLGTDEVKSVDEYMRATGRSGEAPSVADFAAVGRLGRERQEAKLKAHPPPEAEISP